MLRNKCFLKEIFQNGNDSKQKGEWEMPPKCKFTKEEIIQTAFEMVRTDGLSELTARALGGRLGSSPKPIFSIFTSMEEVQEEVTQAAKRLYAEYLERGLKETPAFRGVGTQYILFAIREPKLFQILFMKEQGEILDVRHVLPVIDDNYEKILSSLMEGYQLEEAVAERIYRHLWIYSHGIAALCATKMCQFTKEEIEQMMAEIFRGLLIQELKGEKHD